MKDWLGEKKLYFISMIIEMIVINIMLIMTFINIMIFPCIIPKALYQGWQKNMCHIIWGMFRASNQFN